MRSIAWCLVWLGIAGLMRPAAAQTQPDALEPVIEQVRRGAWARALERFHDLETPARQQPRARYLQARILEALGRFGTAADAMPSGTAGWPEGVEHEMLRRRASLLARAGRCTQARPLLAALAEKSAAMAAQAAQCMLAEGRADAAAKRLQALARGSHRGVDDWVLRLQWAEALQRAGRTEEAVERLTELLVSRPDHPAAEDVSRQLQALGARLELTPEQRLERASRWLKVARPRAALQALEGMRPPRERKQRARWLHVRGMALYRTRHHYAEAARVLRRAAALDGPTAVRDRFHAARALSRAGKDRAAIARYRRLVRRHPRSRWAVTAEFLAAWLQMHHRWPGGVAAMQRFVEGPRGRRSQRRYRDALWELGFAAYRGGHPKAALRYFSRYADTSSAGLIRGRALYWMGRTEMRRRREQAAVAHFREALRVEPFHWYALLARARLQQLGEPVPTPFSEAPEPEAAFRMPELPPVVAFFRELGLRRDAVTALREHERALREAAPEGHGLRALAEGYHALGEHARPYRLVRAQADAWIDHPAEGAMRWAWEAAYPRPYAEHVQAAREEHALPRGLLHAVMRQESGFDPDVVSYAQAIGLMQLIPSTARKVARGLGVEYRREMMFDPRWNVRMGGRLLSRLLRELDGQAVLAIASYNAGAHRVRNWFRKPHPSLDLFVESIPIEQTRNYVRHVVTHWARYRYLTGDDDAWPLELDMTLHRP